MKFLLGTKQEMSQVFAEDGRAIAVTVIVAGPCVVTQIKTSEKEGYDALQLGFGTKKKLNNPAKGHVKDLGNFRFFREIRVTPEEVKSFKVGDKVDATLFAEGDTIEVSGISKGKGFQGVVKRHGFSGGPRTHGQKHSEREPGSIGGGGRAGGRVVKGMRMAGRMGGNRITVKNLKVMKVIPEENKVYVSGAVPGRRGTLIEIKS
jgi:large subunit ribosomal protein L3